MAGKTNNYLTHRELDEFLDLAAADPEQFPERFTELALELVEDLDKREIDLEITDPMTWRKDSGSYPGSPGTPGSTGEPEPRRVALHSQLRHEIESMEHLDREPEAKLARRVEFARLRLEKILREHGMEASDLEGGMLTSPAAYLASGHIDCTMPPHWSTSTMASRILPSISFVSVSTAQLPPRGSTVSQIPVSSITICIVRSVTRAAFSEGMV